MTHVNGDITYATNINATVFFLNYNLFLTDGTVVAVRHSIGMRLQILVFLFH